MQHNSPTTPIAPINLSDLNQPAVLAKVISSPIAPINLSDLNLKTTIAKTVTSSSEA